MPYPPPLAQGPSGHSPNPIVRTIELAQPLHWLGRGWRDLIRCGWVSLLHGVVLPLLGHASWQAYRDLLDVSGVPEREQR